jgi:LacI family transcriptional regulator
MAVKGKRPMGKRPSKVTIADVARLAGVSTATAGRVMGGYGYTSDEIKVRVQHAADRLGYRPNLLARGLITGKTKTIGVVAGDIQSPFYASVLRGIADVARAEGFGVLLTNSDEILDREVEAVQLLRLKQVDGLIVAPCDTERSDHLRRALAEGCPVVQLDRSVRDLPADVVAVDNRRASRDAIARLIDVGHRRIAILAELERWVAGDVSAFVAAAMTGRVTTDGLFPSWQRLLGYVDAHLAAGIPVDPRLILRIGTYSLAGAKAQTLALLADHARPTALFSADGLMSAAAVDAMAERGVELPRDMSLIGFDDLDWMRFIRPGITAIVQPLTTMGQQAANLVLERIRGGQMEKQALALPTTLAERGSVAPPPTGSANTSVRAE